MAAPYLVLILPEAILNANPRTGFIVGLLSLALIATVSIETIFLPLQPSRAWRTRTTSANSKVPSIFTISRTVAVVSIAADSVGAIFGAGTIFDQVAGGSSSPVVSIVTLVSSWRYLAFALFVSSLLGGRASPGSVYRWMAAMVLDQVFITALTAITQPLFAYITFVATVGFVFGIFKARHVLIAILIVLALWPAIFAVRNNIRTAGGVTVNTSVGAEDRLRFDLQISRAEGFPVPVDVGEPGLLVLVRYGVIPRALDSGRPPLSTGYLINTYLGGTSTSAFTFLPLGNIYFLGGYTAIPIFFASWALIVVLLMRARGGPGPVRLCIFALAVAGPLSWANTYPDSMVGFVQNVISAVPVFLVLRLCRPKNETPLEIGRSMGGATDVMRAGHVRRPAGLRSDAWNERPSLGISGRP